MRSTPTTPETGRYVYVLSHETWYHEPDTIPSVHVLHLLEDGGLGWEFVVREVGTGALRVEVDSDDGWSAFADVPEVFGALGSLVELPQGRRTVVPLTEVRDILDRFGFRDITPRTESAESPAPVPWSQSELQELVDGLGGLVGPDRIEPRAAPDD